MVFVSCWPICLARSSIRIQQPRVSILNTVGPVKLWSKKKTQVMVSSGRTIIKHNNRQCAVCTDLFHLKSWFSFYHSKIIWFITIMKSHKISEMSYFSQFCFVSFTKLIKRRIFNSYCWLNNKICLQRLHPLSASQCGLTNLL